MSRSWEMRAVAKTLLFVLAFLVAAAAHAAAQTTTIVLVRHAEKVDDSRDPLLSEAGSERARALATLLAERGVTHIFTTQFQRTRMTAAPLAERLGITPVVIEAAVPFDAAARQILQHAGHTILVVGHSNTVPLMIRALGGPEVAQIPDTDYDDVFVLRIDPAGVKLERSKYGGTERRQH